VGGRESSAMVVMHWAVVRRREGVGEGVRVRVRVRVRQALAEATS
jgi:hypothetical protein